MIKKRTALAIAICAGSAAYISSPLSEFNAPFSKGLSWSAVPDLMASMPVQALVPPAATPSDTTESPAAHGGYVVASDDSNLQFLAVNHAQGRTYIDQQKIADLPEQSTLVRLQGASFLLQADLVPELAPQGEYIYLKTNKPLGSRERRALAELGVENTKFIYKNTWLINVSQEQAYRLADLEFVSTLGQRDLKDKINPAVLKNGFAAQSLQDDDQITVIAEVYQDDQLPSLIETVLAERIVGGADAIQAFGQTAVQMTLPAERLEALLSLNIVSWVDNKAPPNATTNAGAAAASGVDSVQDESIYGLTGAGIFLGIWDGGLADVTHGDLAGRVTLPESVPFLPVIEHATHVSGTMIGSGIGDPTAKGMAPEAQLQSWEWYSDQKEMRSAAEAGLRISNHSYGLVVGWNSSGGVWSFSDNQYEFGNYSSEAREWDDVAYDTDLLMVKAAGNDRDDDGGGAATAAQPADGAASGGYDTVTAVGNAKNIITVGATESVTSASRFSSSWGPADDGRIKPDLSADGANTYSTVLAGGYAPISGTSMAAPVVSGSLALVSQRYQQIYQVEPKASVLKATLIHAADERGAAPGPDNQFGWGFLNTLAAVDSVSRGRDALLCSRITDDLLSQSREITVSDAGEALKVTAVWTDPAAAAGAVQALVNDIDIRLISPSGVEHLPWVTDPSDPGAAAATGVNTVDNIEQIVVEAPEIGVWTLTVETAGLNEGGLQEVSIVTSASWVRSGYANDTDGDNISDDYEKMTFSDVLCAGERPEDSDGDGVPDALEGQNANLCNSSFRYSMQATNPGGYISFGSEAMFYGSSNQFAASALYSGTSRCSIDDGSGAVLMDCQASGASVHSMNLGEFPANDSENDYYVGRSKSLYLGGDEVTEFGAIGTNNYAKVTFEAPEGSTYHIKSLSLARGVSLTLSPGVYWIDALSMSNYSKIYVVGTGTAVVHVKNYFSVGRGAKVNWIDTDETSTDKLLMFAHSGIGFSNYSYMRAYLYSPSHITLGRGTQFAGAMAAGNVTLGISSDVFGLSAALQDSQVETMDFGTVCDIDSDGIYDGFDDDEDGDGVTDIVEESSNTDPRNPESTP